MCFLLNGEDGVYLLAQWNKGGGGLIPLGPIWFGWSHLAQEQSQLIQRAALGET